MADIQPARFPEDVDVVRELMREYMDGLRIDLSFQNVDSELRDIPGRYAPPRGVVLLARNSVGDVVGGVALRPFDATTCEMKRLYVRPTARGGQLGRKLAQAVLRHARGLGYRVMLLDTLASMAAAQSLYRSLDFVACAPYYDNPLADTVYMRCEL